MVVFTAMCSVEAAYSTPIGMSYVEDFVSICEAKPQAMEASVVALCPSAGLIGCCKYIFKQEAWKKEGIESSNCFYSPNTNSIAVLKASCLSTDSSDLDVEWISTVPKYN